MGLKKTFVLHFSPIMGHVILRSYYDLQTTNLIDNSPSNADIGSPASRGFAVWAHHGGVGESLGLEGE